jgi:hypothetical protein
MDALLEQVVEFTAQHRGGIRKKIVPTARLAQDLGIDGDDAVEFFKHFGERFGVDLKGLWEDWDQYFVPEGGPGVAFFLTCISLMVVGQGLHKLLGLLPFWIWGSALIVLWVWPLRCWPQRPKGSAPIIVQNLVDAAGRKQWHQSEVGERYKPRALNY